MDCDETFESEVVRLICSCRWTRWIVFDCFEVCLLVVWYFAGDPERRRIFALPVKIGFPASDLLLFAICLPRIVVLTLELPFGTFRAESRTHKTAAVAPCAHASLDSLKVFKLSRLLLCVFDIFLFTVLESTPLTLFLQALQFFVLSKQICDGTLAAEEMSMARARNGIASGQ